ncbi:MAG: hypothetical protein RL033_381 [Pseudomonadota bacterium]
MLRLAALLAALGPGSAHAQAIALDQMVQRNRDPFIPAQCYAQTVDPKGGAHNSCYTCHVGSRAPNYIDDGALQLGYDFVPRARNNPWTNLFVDWPSPASTEERSELLRYLRESNYFDAAGEIRLQRALDKPPREWDFDDDGRWSGFVPDVQYRIDSAGYDRLADGGYSGWRSYAYYPLPGSFLPSNGSLGDAFVRLPEAFRQDAAGKLDVDLYAVNLAVVEALIRQQDVAIPATAEAALGVDLDLDGRLGTASVVRFRAPGQGRALMSYVGRAQQEQAAGRVQLSPGLFPEGTEFLHTLRYLDPTPQGVRMSARLKELRYARKTNFWSSQRLEQRAQQEAEEKADSPAEARSLAGNVERGVFNGQGWWLQGFIEDAAGELRPQTFEETAFCVGCHGGVGRTDDSIFSFGRRLSFAAWRHGWYHPSQRGFEQVPDPPAHAGTSSEYVTYLQENGAADDFRQNDEARSKFFDAQGHLRPELRARLQRDISELLLPSASRALALDGAYRALVRSQSFAAGRDVVLGGAKNAHRRVPAGEKTGVTRAVAHGAAGHRYVRASAGRD